MFVSHIDLWVAIKYFRIYLKSKSLKAKYFLVSTNKSYITNNSTDIYRTSFSGDVRENKEPLYIGTYDCFCIITQPINFTLADNNCLMRFGSIAFPSISKAFLNTVIESLYSMYFFVSSLNFICEKANTLKKTKKH